MLSSVSTVCVLPVVSAMFILGPILLKYRNLSAFTKISDLLLVNFKTLKILPLSKLLCINTSHNLKGLLLHYQRLLRNANAHL